MKEIVKYALICLAVALFYLVWISIFPVICSYLVREEAVFIGTALFLSFEMAILASVIISKLKN